jgi:hypothetical protein
MIVDCNSSTEWNASRVVHQGDRIHRLKVSWLKKCLSQDFDLAVILR